jgi:galactokinase
MREKEQALQLLLQRFGEVGRVFAAPARVNLIGEHTDYTSGLVMPMAIGFGTLAVLSQRTRQQGGLLLDEFRRRGFVRDRFDDCRSWEFELLPLPVEVRVAICNSMVKHAVAAGEYSDCRPLQRPTIRYLTRHSLIRWGCIPRRAMGVNTRSGSFMPTFILPYCARRRFASSWWDLNY